MPSEKPSSLENKIIQNNKLSCIFGLFSPFQNPSDGYHLKCGIKIKQTMYIAMIEIKAQLETYFFGHTGSTHGCPRTLEAKIAKEEHKIKYI